MARRRNSPLYPSEAAALRAILSRHGYRSNPYQSPEQANAETVKIVKRRNPRRRKVKMFGPGKRWRTKKAMLRYLSKIRRKALRVLRRRRSRR